MQIIVLKWGSVLLFPLSSCLISSSFVAYFQSTHISYEKWNNSSDFIGAKPSKTYFKYETRTKHANAKKALNDLLSSKNRRDTLKSSWSFKSWEESSSQSQTNGSDHRNNKWRTAGDDESDDDDESYVVGSHSDRLALGLPINGPLKIEEVKNDFHISVLKWHPDKHQGPSQALAEEKFKVCLNAYKSLCNALSKVYPINNLKPD